MEQRLARPASSDVSLRSSELQTRYLDDSSAGDAQATVACWHELVRELPFFEYQNLVDEDDGRRMKARSC